METAPTPGLEGAGHGGTWQLPELRRQSREGTGKQYLYLSSTDGSHQPHPVSHQPARKTRLCRQGSGFPHQGTESGKSSEWVSESEQGKHPLAVVE